MPIERLRNVSKDLREHRRALKRFGGKQPKGFGRKNWEILAAQLRRKSK